jgi:hypothetical protein
MKKIVFIGYFLMHSAVFSHNGYVYGDLLGRMGNYLFEVATASALAWDNNAVPYFPHLEELNPSNPLCTHVLFRCNKQLPPKDLKIAHEFVTPVSGYTDITFKPNMKLAGYCQSEKYFSHHRERLIQLFAPTKRDLKYIQKKYKDIINHPNSVSIHVRHYYAEVPGGMYLQFDKDYYEKAMSLFPKDSLFVVTSDDIRYARSIIPISNRRVKFLKGEQFYIDFHIQRLCKNNIITNSTFSWWSAWLNDNPSKKVIRPKRWVTAYPDLDSPADWIRIDSSCYQDRI